MKETTEHKDFYNYIKEIALKLDNKRIVAEDVGKNNRKTFNTIRLINKPRYTEGSNNLIVDLDKDLIPYIIDLKKEFTRYQIENILKLNSSYAVRVYEPLKQYERIGGREITKKIFRHLRRISKIL